MVKFMKPGKVVIVLNGKYAGKKAVIVKQYDDGDNKRPFPHALVVGIERAPLKVTKRMGKELQAKRARVKPFIKCVNYNHVLPTRYAIDVDLKSVITKEVLKDKPSRLAARKEAKKILEERFKSGKNKWFFNKLRF
eukprot:Clim_evm13s152 gene=Clim_evmTU13s152